MYWSEDILDESERMILALRTLYRRHGYERYRMSKFEEYDLYGKNKDFLISDHVITFTDANGALKALRPDVTLSVIKNHPDEPDTLRKLCYNENVYRVPKGGDSFREIMQVGLECIGRVDAACVGEVLRLAAESLELCAPDYVLEVSHLDILTAFVDGVAAEGETRREVLKCVSEKNVHGMEAAAKEAPADRVAALRELMRLYGPAEQVLPALRRLCEGRGMNRALAELQAAAEALGRLGGERMVLDFSSVGSMSYYNGIQFRGFAEGVPESVLSGGQYDKLMRRMHRRSRAVGFAVYLDKLERLGAMGESGVNRYA